MAVEYRSLQNSAIQVEAQEEGSGEFGQRANPDLDP
jgi:hypothetical protein